MHAAIEPDSGQRTGIGFAIAFTLKKVQDTRSDKETEIAMPKSIPATRTDFDRTRVIERPDGFYWQDKDSDEEYGPFPTLIEAAEDMEYSDESDFEPGETLAEAEDELGISDWIDPDTGAPAEEGRPHIEDH
ncbi:hypothetical protein RHDC3_01545 [Rhodocyclaceae bacterium]|nr:hypothetical protein RHDC3_01545 [Rhodocyclaceae bacterium]